MKVSLPARATPALLIAGVLTVGLAAPGLAQTGSSTAGTSPTVPSGPATTTTTPAAPANTAATPPSAPSNTVTMPPAGSAAANAPNAHAAAPAAHRAMSEEQLVERRIADLHAKLHITPAQSKQWNAFTNVMRENARNIDQAYRQRAQKLQSMTALQNLESYAQLEQTRAHDVNRLVPPFRHLYASLSPQQKQEADELFRSYAEHHRHGTQTSSR